MNKLTLLGLVLVLAAGCASQKIPDPDPNDTVYDSGSDSGFGANTGGMDDGMLGRGEEIEDEMNGDLTMVIYFDFDQSELRAEYADVLQRHASRLVANRRLQVRLEGHADERGSREYNIGLGERRSQAVRRLLMIQGAAADQISTVSFGEERPAAFGSDEQSYQLNRRVEIKYLN